MASALGWRPKMAARYWRVGAQRAASAFRPEPNRFAMAAAPSPTLDRLRRRRQFLDVAATRRKWVAPGLILQARARPDDGPELRLGFTATRKIGNAVIRNRARRRLRAVAREVLGQAAAVPADLVLIARQDTVARPYAELKRDLETAVARLGILQR